MIVNYQSGISLIDAKPPTLPLVGEWWIISGTYHVTKYNLCL
jgi:hypothetical protein